MLAQCPNCGATISTRSVACPKCHGPLRAPTKNVAGTVFIWIFAGFNALMLAWLGFYMITGRVTLRTPRIEGDSAGTPVGGEMGIGFLILLWFLGLLILGLCAMFNLAHQPHRENEHRAAR